MSNLQEVQRCELRILKAIREVCEKHHLRYYLCYGTLLGAVRHGGFIPWDNDIDIEMPVEDYRKFLELGQKELGEDFFLQTYRTDPGYNEMWAKVRANGTTSLPVAWKALDIHWGIGVDIFPLTGLADDPRELEGQKRALDLCRLLISKDFTMAVHPEEAAANRKLRLVYALPRRVSLALCRKLEKKIYRNFDGAKIVSTVEEGLCFRLDTASYGKGAVRGFEDGEFSVPEDWDAILRAIYGDYMTPPPESERNGHEGLLGKIIYECDMDYRHFTAKH